jgi:hypothetical protein
MALTPKLRQEITDKLDSMRTEQRALQDLLDQMSELVVDLINRYSSPPELTQSLTSAITHLSDQRRENGKTIENLIGIIDQLLEIDGLESRLPFWLRGCEYPTDTEREE